MLRWLNRIALGYIALATLLALRRGTVEALLVLFVWGAIYLVFYGIVRASRPKPKPVKPEVIDEDDPLYNELPNMDRK